MIYSRIIFNIIGINAIIIIGRLLAWTKKLEDYLARTKKLEDLIRTKKIE